MVRHPLSDSRADSPLAFDPLRSLPNASYREPEWLQAELANIWHNDWVFVTSEDAVSEPGDQLPVIVGRQPVLLVRDQDGALQALSNLCTHRGTLLVDEPANAKRIQCPYHAWTFADSGRLLSVPFSPKGEVDKTAHCLPAYRVEVWHGLVFVSLNADVESVADRFAAVESAIADYDVDDLYHWSHQQTTETWDCNWKLAILNAMESYHLFQVHPETLEPYTPTKDAYYLSGSARATAVGHLATDGSRSVLLSLPPGFVGVVSKDSLVWLAVEPVDVDRCTIRTGGAFAHRPTSPDAGRISKWITQVGDAAYSVMQPDFLPEDKAICERGQRGATGDFTPALLLGVEQVVRDFGHYLVWRLQRIEPPAVVVSTH